MSERTLSELANAEIVPNAGGPNAWMVRFGENDYDLVNKSVKNRLVLVDGVLGEGVNQFDYGGVGVGVDMDNDRITLRRDNETVSVPSSKHEHVLWSIHDEDGPRLQRLFESLHVPTVRQGLMDMLMPRFRQEKSDIRKTGEGWLVNGDILVGWDAENHPVNVAQTHVVRGGETVEADEDKEAREIRFDIPDNKGQVKLPNGTTTELDDVEVKFLTTVALVLGRNTGHYDDYLADVIENSRIVKFTDTKSGLHHGHTMDKHTLSMLGVTDEAADRLWYNDYDHTGVWEMAVRREEFEDAPIDVFEDAPNDDPQKWRDIQSTKDVAPIPKHIRADLEARYGQ